MSGPSFSPTVQLPALYAPSQFVPLPLVQYNPNQEGHDQRFSFVPDTFALFPCYFPQPTSSIDTSLMLASIPQPRLASEVAPPQCEEEGGPAYEPPSQPRRKKASPKKVDEDPDYMPHSHNTRSHNKRSADKSELEEQKHDQPAVKKSAETPPSIAAQRQPNARRINIYQTLKNKIFMKSPFLKRSIYEKYFVENKLLEDLSTEQIFDLAYNYVYINTSDSHRKSFLNFLYRNNLLQKLSPDQIQQLMKIARHTTQYVFTEILFDSDYFKNFSIIDKIGILQLTSKNSIFDDIHKYYNDLIDYCINIESTIKKNDLSSLKDCLNNPLFNELSAADLTNLVSYSRNNHNNLIAQFMLLHKYVEDYQPPENIKYFFTFIKNHSDVDTDILQRLRTDLHIADQDLLEIITGIIG